ncbi:MAG: ABC transporter ATP-binding protein [Gammaproteobacteria bacterium]|nr:ABC transporter ATP-binding protein [Gammaproteobacteria bacterium]MYD75430.1 ABC transporter ATP-binding protein [Gammaproteobacteria bacterium]MYJ53099.1 ABC transporter ATP-binding protein [Gammaproteobacteria bacterium]
MKLSVSNLEVSYNKVSALRGISFEVDSGDFVTLIGSNGAGKSTTLRTISGLVKPSGGEITLDGARIDNLDPDVIVQKRIGHVPEGRRIFKDLSVSENLMLGAYIHRDRNTVEKTIKQVFEHFPRLHDRRNQQAGTMSGGEQQMLAIGRALMSRPKILLLDEPSLGLAPIIVKEIGEFLSELNSQGVTVILVEQNADLALQLARFGYVLETGLIAMADRAANLADNEHVKKAYLGI